MYVYMYFELETNGSNYVLDLVGTQVTLFSKGATEELLWKLLFKLSK